MLILSIHFLQPGTIRLQIAHNLEEMFYKFKIYHENFCVRNACRGMTEEVFHRNDFDLGHEE